MLPHISKTKGSLGLKLITALSVHLITYIFLSSMASDKGSQLLLGFVYQGIKVGFFHIIY